MGRKYHIICACSCWGAQIRACEMGPEDLLEGKVFERLQAQGVSIGEVEVLYPKIRARDANLALKDTLPIIVEFNRALVQSVHRAEKQGRFPVVVGGDHTNAIGTWNGIQGPLGLLWLDAHMDAHTPETTPSGAYHGMPLAALLGHGNQEMAQLIRKEPVLQPHNVAIIGVRSFEPGEAALLKKLNVRVYFMDEVRRRGLKAILPEAISHVMQGATRLGISVDLDFFDPKEAPGVGSGAEQGVHPSEFLPLISLFRNDPRFAAFELVEFNPERDVNHKTRELAHNILYEVTR